MKLFQIEEPDGSPLDAAAGLGAAVGIDIADGIGRVAIALGGNPEILPDADGKRSLTLAETGETLASLLLGLRSRAEKQLARPVTHAVVSADLSKRAAIETAAAEAGIAILRLVDRATSAALARGAAPEEASVLGAAIAAEEAAPVAR